MRKSVLKQCLVMLLGLAAAVTWLGGCGSSSSGTDIPPNTAVAIAVAAPDGDSVTVMVVAQGGQIIVGNISYSLSTGTGTLALGLADVIPATFLADGNYDVYAFVDVDGSGTALPNPGDLWAGPIPMNVTAGVGLTTIVDTDFNQIPQGVVTITAQKAIADGIMAYLAVTWPGFDPDFAVADGGGPLVGGIVNITPFDMLGNPLPDGIYTVWIFIDINGNEDTTDGPDSGDFWAGPLGFDVRWGLGGLTILDGDWTLEP